MNRVFAHLVTTAAVASLTLFAVGCGKKEQPKPETTPPPAAETTPAAEADTAEAPAPEADTAAVPVEADAAAPAATDDVEAAAADVEAAAMPEEYIQFHVMHHQVEKGMVDGHFETFQLLAANTDLAHPEHAMAKVAIDLGSIKTGIDKRDNHVKSTDFFDVAKFATATVTVTDVKPTDTADEYTATATLDLHGVQKAFPMTFKVVDKGADGAITVEAEVKELARTDWGVGATPEETNVAEKLDVNVRLKLTNKTEEEAPKPE